MAAGKGKDGRGFRARRGDVLTSMRPTLSSSFWWHRQQLPLQQTAASAVTETETDYLLHLQRVESDGHCQLM